MPDISLNEENRVSYSEISAEIQSLITNSLCDPNFQIKSTEIFMSEVMNSVKDEFHEFIHSEGIDLKNFRVQAFLEKCELGELYKGMQSSEGQIKALKENYFYIESKTLIESKTSTVDAC